MDDIYAAREELILSRRTHLDQLAHKLEEARVRRVVEPILSGGEVQHDSRDLEYIRDLGLLAPDSPPRIANPIYAEVVPRELGYVLQDSLDVQTRVVRGRRRRLEHDEAADGIPHLLRRTFRALAGALLRLPRGGTAAYLAVVPAAGGERGRSHRAGVRVGARPDDLLVLWPRESGQPSDLWERFVVECKVLRDSDRKSLEWTIERAWSRRWWYMKKCGAEEGHLVMIDRRAGAEERRGNQGEVGGSEERRQDGRKVAVWTL